jgi:hypothetical protein
MDSRPYRFQATIYRIWMMRHIDVPDEIVRELQKQMARNGRAPTPNKQAKQSGADRAGHKQANPKYIPVVAIVNGKTARTTLVPAGGGRFRMQINTALRKAARADVGDLVGVELRLDRASRTVPVPADLRAGLKQHPKAWKAFEGLAPGHRRQFIQWYDSAKSPEARGRRLNRAIDALLERALLGQSRRQKQERGARLEPRELR